MTADETTFLEMVRKMAGVISRGSNPGLAQVAAAWEKQIDANLLAQVVPQPFFLPPRIGENGSDAMGEAPSLS